jgi:hypothetical protein
VRAFSITVSAVFVAVSAALFMIGSEWESGPDGLFLLWLGVHLAYGAVLAAFWTLPVALLVPVVVAPLPWDGGETAYWVQALFVEAFYGVPFVFIGVIGRRLWQARRPAELPPVPRREESRG